SETLVELSIEFQIRRETVPNEKTSSELNVLTVADRRRMTEHQIDFPFVPQSLLLSDIAATEDDGFRVSLQDSLKVKFETVGAQHGFPIRFVDEFFECMKLLVMN